MNVKLSSQSSLRVAALNDHFNTPSSRFRIQQYIDFLSGYGIKVTNLCRKYSTQSAGQWYPDDRIRSSPKKLISAAGYEMLNLGDSFLRALLSRGYDAAWVSRELVWGYPTFEFLINENIFYDIDDAVFLRPTALNRGINTLIRRAKCVFAGNKYLADYCSQYSQNVLVVPTAVDVDRFIRSTNKNDYDKKFTIGWSGTSSSFPYLLSIEKQLLAFLEKHPNSLLKICSDRFPKELSAISRYLVFEKWSAQDEVRQIQEFDVGLMPMMSSEWANGKCSYKMLLYASCGIPTIASNFGMNKDVLALGKVGIGCDTADAWFDSLCYVYDRRGSLSTVFPDARKVVEENFSLKVVSRIISRAFMQSCAA